MDPITFHNEQRKVSDLIPWQQNPRQMSKEMAAKLKHSLEYFNLTEPPVIDTDNTIVSGHQRVATLKLLGRGDEQIDVRVPNRKLTADEVRELNIGSNLWRGEFDWDKLADFDIDLLKDLGFNDKELQLGLGLAEESESLGYTITCPHCQGKIKSSNRVKNVEAA